MIQGPVMAFSALSFLSQTNLIVVFAANWGNIGDMETSGDI